MSYDHGFDNVRLEAQRLLNMANEGWKLQAARQAKIKMIDMYVKEIHVIDQLLEDLRVHQRQG